MTRFICLTVLVAFCVSGALAQMTVKNTSGYVLMEVNDEGFAGSITLPIGQIAPTVVTNKLYNENGNLKWNGMAVALGSAGVWSQSGSDIYYNSGNVGIGTVPTSLLHVVQTGMDPTANFETQNASNPSHTIIAETNSQYAAAIYGENTDTYYNSYGALGAGWGVYGFTDNLAGVHGSSSNGVGVEGVDESTLNNGYLGGDSYGVYGSHYSTGDYGYLGSGNYGAYGYNSTGNYGYLGSSAFGVYGSHPSSGNYGYVASSNSGVVGYSTTTSPAGGGVYGSHSNGNFGYIAPMAVGVYGKHGSSGNYGWLGNSSYGVYGYNNSSGNYCYLGSSNFAAYGYNNSSGNQAYIASSSNGVYGEHNSSGNYGWIGSSLYGVYGFNGSSASVGYLAGAEGVYGYSYDDAGVAGYTDNGIAVYGVQGTGLSSTAATFIGDVNITGFLSKGSGSFKIDHPLDPENKFLYHSFVESPDMMNVYNGNEILDSNGEAVVQLPEWFGALNKDYRYQLTAIGAPSPNLYVAEGISNNRFRIAGGAPGMEVSWQVTGIRQDAYANAHRIEVEVEKSDQERGKYLHPLALGLPEDMGINYESIQKFRQEAERHKSERMEAQQDLEKMQRENQQEIERQRIEQEKHQHEIEQQKLEQEKHQREIDRKRIEERREELRKNTERFKQKKQRKESQKKK